MLDIPRQFVRYNQNVVTPVFTGIEIGETYNPYGRTSEYVVYVSFMHGDGDSYETEECAFAADDEERLLEFLNFLSRCASRDVSRHRDSYKDIPGYSRWVEDEDFNEDDYEDLDEDELEAKREEFEEEGGTDQVLNWPFWEGEYCAAYNGAHVVYFDEHGNQKTVKLSTD